jgi:limonene-1,2-epoxide hydrolase
VPGAGTNTCRPARAFAQMSSSDLLTSWVVAAFVSSDTSPLEVNPMTPKEVVKEWIKRFNAADIEGLIRLYAPDAVNHQVVTDPLHGRDAIRRFFAVEFGRAQMVCIEENLLESGDWAILEWRDPLGLRGCGFFQIKDDQIVFQRGYFDQLTFFKIRPMEGARALG